MTSSDHNSVTMNTWVQKYTYMCLHRIDDLAGGVILNAVGAVHSAMTDRGVPAIATDNHLLSPQTLQVLLLLLPPYIAHGLVEVLHLMPVECRWHPNSDIHKMN